MAAVRALVRVSRALERTLGELSLPHYRVLAAVSAGEEIAARVAERLALGRPAVSAAVAALCDRGFLVRVDVEADQRAEGLRLTESGWEALERADAVMAGELRAITGKLQDPAEVIEALAQLNEAVSARYADRRSARTPGTGADRSAPEKPAGQ